MSLEDWYLEELYLESLYKEFTDDFFCIEVKEKLIGFILAMKHTSNFGFISNFVILQKFRKCGYGTKLFEYALNHLKGCQVALECEKDTEKFYARYGFTRYYDSVYYIYEKQEEETSSANENISSVVDKELLSTATKYIDGYKVVIEAQSYKKSKEIFFSLIKKYQLNTKIYIEVTNLEPNLVKLSKDLNMKEFSRKSRMYNKIVQ